jgi:2-polyprenyl-6-methoxyphenol hydroxylase-like FAD-dependent oxidoreductase
MMTLTLASTTTQARTKTDIETVHGAERTMSSQPGQVVIVGAGPAGMALAYLLARRGVGVTVLETHHDFARVFRGEGLQRSGIEALRQMGLGEKFDRVPYTEIRTIEVYLEGRLVARADPTKLGRGQARLVPQPLLLQLLADEAAQYPAYRLERGVTVRDFLRENGRVVGVRADAADGSREYRAHLVVGADGRNAVTRKQSGLPELFAPQAYDILWLKVPYCDRIPDRMTAVYAAAANRAAAIAYPTADGQLQVGFVIAKGGFAALRARAADEWTEELIARLPAYLAEHLRVHRQAVATSTLLNVVCGRLTEWTVPGLLLIGDAAHPMSPVGGQGINIALRDALVAANHLCPVLTAGGKPSALDAAARKIQEERWPEIVAVQKMQQNQARLLFASDRWSARLVTRLIPLLLRTGLLQWLHRKEYRQMSEGVVPVRLVV